MPPDTDEPAATDAAHDECLPYCWCRNVNNTPSTVYRFKPGDEPLRFPPVEDREAA